MRAILSEYYPPRKEEYELLWKKAVFAFDTNVLLDLYRTPDKSRGEFIEAISSIRDRIWIPFHVALEYQRRRLSVIAREKQIIEETLKYAKGSVNDIKSKFDNLQIENRGIEIDSTKLMSELEDVYNKISKAVTSASENQIDVGASDPIRSRLDDIFAERVGEGPASQAEYDKLVEDGDDRYLQRIPPGFEDEGKQKNPNEASFIHNKIKYERKFGDLIIWRQLLSYIKSNNVDSVIFVTSDQKDDWWWRENGKTIGPHPELVREIRRETEVSNFWMYSSVDFIRYAKKFGSTNISEESIKEVSEIAREISVQKEYDEMKSRKQIYSSISASIDEFNSGLERIITRNIYQEDEIFSWLKRFYKNIVKNERGFDFIVSGGFVSRGYEIYNLKSSIEGFYSKLIDLSLKLRSKAKSRELEECVLIVIIPRSHVDDYKFNVVQAQIDDVARRSKIAGVIIGFFGVDGFDVLSFSEGESVLGLKECR